ncbi:hypothetical protein LEP48_00740 [Isoptericola sp. NEAU-Y5]|uniref:Lipoprotein n=1 Tax=Isoptericola luteus TaxID=2879484 RepID=A0ABS7ZBN2_9MICO|nr:hypothetical protein [Isoptericola sp. NEAU-Y5]MCA5891877.1 hypothetical protein [Isoptericola sp. NEAU-Y5]
MTTEELAAAKEGLAAKEAAHEDWIAQSVRCLREKGWEGVTADAGGLSYETLPRDQAGAFTDDMAACEDAVGPGPYDEPLTRAEVAVVYDRWVDAKACLEGLGHEISEPPSVNVFIDDYLHGDDGPWSPFAELPAGVALDRVKQTCPE